MLVRFLFCFVGLSLFASGQVKEDENRYFRILPLGNMHQFREKLVNGIRVTLPPRPGEAPPPSASVKDEVPQKGGLTLRVDQISRFVALGPKTKQVQIFEVAKEAEKEWYAFKAPLEKRSLAVLYRDHKKLDWFNTKSLILKDDVKIFPVGSARFVNVSDRTLAMLFTFKKNGKQVEERKGLAPGKVYIRPLAPEGEKAEIYLYEKGKAFEEMVEIFSNRIRAEDGMRFNAFFYKNSSKKGAPVRKVMLPESIPVLPSLPKLAGKVNVKGK